MAFHPELSIRPRAAVTPAARRLPCQADGGRCRQIDHELAHAGGAGLAGNPTAPYPGGDDRATFAERAHWHPVQAVIILMPDPRARVLGVQYATMLS